MVDSQTYIKHIDAIVETYREIADKPSVLDVKAYGIIARIRDTVEKAAGANSYYALGVNDILEEDWNIIYKLEALVGILQVMRDALEIGLLTSFSAVVHARIFDNFLDMAEYLLSEGYKDAAAVLVGGTIEIHLRQLCKKNNIDTMFKDKSGTTHPKKASQLNQDLAGLAYSKGDQKNVTAWLDLRNHAAHANYDQYDDKQVDLTIVGVRYFIQRNPT